MRVSNWVVHQDASHWPRYSHPELTDPVCPHMEKTAPLSSQLSHHPSRQSAITPHIHADPHDSFPKSGGQTATLRDTCTYRAIQLPATGLHTPQATRLPGRPAHRFHFISATLLLDSQKRRCSAAASLLLKPLGTWSFPVPLRENLCPAKLPVRWFCKPKIGRAHV